tara:strand:- start:344 stop:637 length:294 start_codon:yes stop_codon:yes gene_type:complete
MTNPYNNPSLLKTVQAKARKIGVKVKPSKRKNKKLDVFKGDKKVASIGDVRYKDFLLYRRTEGAKKANMRRRLYKIRHNKTRGRVGTPSYYADKILW